MKKEILEALKARFDGVSESVLGRIADKLAKTATTAEEVKTAGRGYPSADNRLLCRQQGYGGFRREVQHRNLGDS